MYSPASSNTSRATPQGFQGSLKSLRVVDSITELKAEDEGCLAVSGSHGGLSAARYAVAARPLLSVFNDAGIGKNEAGIAGLALLQLHRLAACTVSHNSASIGDAHSTLNDGVIQHVNLAARALGILPGQRCADVIRRMQMSD